MHHRTVVSLGSLAALAAILLLGLAACGGSAASTASSLQGTTLQGKPFALTQTTAKPTVVNFFASWCPSCNDEATDLVAFATAHPEVRFIGVAVNDGKADATRFVTQFRVPFTVVMDPDGQVAGDWGVDGIPATFFLDKDGRQQASIVGPASRAQFEERLKSIL
jgi:cytochrome c biogenesis protein CcmG, thiol:disulfide interchange protein DsbE